MGKITVNIKNEQLKILVAGKAPSWVSVPQKSGPLEETTRLKLSYQQWNTKRMRVVRLSVYGVVGLSSED